MTSASGVAARIETTALACGATSAATVASCGGLWHRTTTSARWATSAADAERLAADLLGQRLRALGDDVGAQQRPTPAEGEPSGHAPGADEAEHHGSQLWLKKPFSMSSARSSAEISTLRGVSMKTLSAIRCMPPSRA